MAKKYSCELRTPEQSDYPYWVKVQDDPDWTSHKGLAIAVANLIYRFEERWCDDWCTRGFHYEEIPVFDPQTGVVMTKGAWFQFLSRADAMRFVLKD
jgi:hypothetical protein